VRAYQNGVQLWSLQIMMSSVVNIGREKQRTRLGMRHTCGVEISVSYLDQTIHIVGVGINPDDEGLVEGLRQTRDGRSARGRETEDNSSLSEFRGPMKVP
jgi:predicted metal-dependent phosphoesterase TrpH